MRRLVLVAPVVAILAALAPGAQSTARAGTECDGLLVCIPVAGPWVKIPAQSGSRRLPTYYHLSCPPGSVIGGLDAEVTHRSIELSFAGALGGPISPGVTTSTAAVFAGTETGRIALPTAFKPLLGCVPGGGGGRGRTMRPPTRSLSSAAAKPVDPVVRRVKSFRLRAGREVTGSLRCRADERLVSFAHAVAFHMKRAPTARELSEVDARASVRGGRVSVTGVAGEVVSGLPVRAQIQVVCARPNP
jgi:hypothetical protein